MIIKHYPKNELGKDFVIGDIHGCFDEVKRLMKVNKFNKKKDRLFSVGDLVDRGEQSLDALKWLKKPWFFPVRGNHEQLAIDWSNGGGGSRHNYESNGGLWFINLSKRKQKNIAKIFDTMPVALDFITNHNGLCGIVHAECPHNNWKELVSFLEHQDKYDSRYPDNLKMIWGRNIIYTREEALHTIPNVANIDCVISGHTTLMNGPVNIGNRLYIDTGFVYKESWSKMTMINVI
jgi:serine/threonine protein phosphatase 1